MAEQERVRLVQVLVAEDDAGLRNVVGRLLECLGYDPIIVDDGAAAVAMIQDRAADLMCVLLDVVMPTMDGITAALAIRHAAPHLPIVLMSGYVPHDLDLDDANLRCIGLLRKPFSVSELSAMLVRANTAALEVEAL
jgi:CheY-like chemotaxis protein